MEIRNLSTETRNKDSMNLDKMSSFEIVSLMNKQDMLVPTAITPELEKISAVVDWVTEAFYAGNRLFYIGAGTSGRLGVLDASECPPTYGVPKDMVIGLIAGGDYALRNAVENAEDDKDLAVKDLQEHNFKAGDVLVGIAASGRTPYVIGGLEYAKSLGCKTASISCNNNSEIGKIADVAIEAVVGPEVLTGSSRLKSGTAQKLICNMITTAAMVRTGKSYQNLMVNVVQSNEKLKVRAENIVIDATDVDRETARKYIDMTKGNVKTAIVMILTNCDYDKAIKKLEAAKGHTRIAIEN